MLRYVAAVLTMLVVLAMAPAFADDSRMARSISVSGHGEVLVVPDMATLSIGVTSQGTSAREALDGNTKAMKALLDTLKSAGVEGRDIATSNFSVGPRFDYGNNTGQPPKVVGYDVNNMVTVLVRKIDDLGGLLDVAVTTGSNTVNALSFAVSKPEALLDEARKAAVADARRKAEIYATAGGFKLGNIMSLTEGTAAQPPMPYMMKSARAESSDPVPIAQGEQALSVDVSMVYEIE